jgi:hypothetical protein
VDIIYRPDLHCLFSLSVSVLAQMEVSLQPVTVDTSPPNPDTTGVHAVPGSANVTVNILPGAELTVANNNVIVIQDQPGSLEPLLSGRTRLPAPDLWPSKRAT